MKEKLDDESMRLLAEMLEAAMPEGWGFTLLAFETNSAAPKLRYISNAQRESMKGTMQAMLDKWNRGEDFTKPNMN